MYIYFEEKVVTMRILHILQTPRISGAENVVADICMMFEGNIDMMYCSPDGPIRQALEDRGVEFSSLRKRKISDLKGIIKKYKPDIIHAHDVRATVLATLTAGKIPVVSHLHGNMEDMRKIGLKSILYMLAAKKVKTIITVSEGCLKDYIFKKKIEKKTLCMRNVIHEPRIQKLMNKDSKEYNIDFVFMGRLSYPKNPQRVAKVASIVLKQCPKASFGIIGNGELKNEMESVFMEEGVIDRVVFTDRLAYPYKALEQAKCMIMCSRFEGTPIAGLEAMALGVPIVSTPVDGMLDLVDDENTGYLRSEDKALANAIIGLLTEKNKREVMSDNSIRRFGKLNASDRYKTQLNDIYCNVVR
ncbi:glycosyltransferase [Paenibacillus sp. FSL R10-2796]|uniref:glycosyltransferase n=1 Tax=Paenibacillus sp. FSL R10-2796 TaxID=2954663 RepID=UPI0030DA1961